MKALRNGKRYLMERTNVDNIEQDLISVIIPAYNCEKYIDNCIKASENDFCFANQMSDFVDFIKKLK